MVVLPAAFGPVTSTPPWVRSLPSTRDSIIRLRIAGIWQRALSSAGRIAPDPVIDLYPNYYRICAFSRRVEDVPNTTSFASVYPYYIAKAEKKGRTKAEVDEIIRWLTGYDQQAFDGVLEGETVKSLLAGEHDRAGGSGAGLAALSRRSVERILGDDAVKAPEVAIA